MTPPGFRERRSSQAPPAVRPTLPPILGPQRASDTGSTYQRSKAHEIVHDFIEQMGRFGTIPKVLSRLFAYFDNIDMIQVWVANEELAHMFTMTKNPDGTIQLDCSNHHLTEDDARLDVFRRPEVQIYDRPNGISYMFDLDPSSTAYELLPIDKGDMKHALLPLYSAMGQHVLGVLVIGGENLSLNGTTYTGAATIVESTDIFISIARLISAEILHGYDHLTGLPREKQFGSAIEEAINLLFKNGKNAAVIRFDIDRLKRINDRFGHAAGDLALRTFAKIAGDSIRCDPATSIVPDTLFRLGGGADEFIVLLPGVDTSTGLVVAERVRQAIESITASMPEFKNSEGKDGFSVSCGVGDLKTILGKELRAHEPGEEIVIPIVREKIEKRTDVAAYAAKQNGRNRVYYLKPSETGELVTVHYTP